LRLFPAPANLLTGTHNWKLETFMLRKCCFLLILLFVQIAGAQDDALNLPTELYVLTNSGFAQQYGLGLAGLTTVTPEDTFVLDVGAAPDGNWLAYRTEAGLTLLNMYTDEQIQVEGATAGIPPVRGEGDTIAWSPDGDAIVYTTPYGARAHFTGSSTFLDLPQGELRQLIWSPGGGFLAAQADQNIWWLFRREADNLILHGAIPSALDVVWANDSQLLFTPADGGLIRMDLAAANAQTVLLDNTWIYRLPYPLGDGSILMYGRQKSNNSVPEGSGQLLSLPPGATQTQPMSENAIDLTGLQWTPGGQLLIAFRGGVMAAVIPATGQGLTLPVADAVAYTWGAPPLEKATSLNLPYNGYFIADGAEGIKQVWWLPADGSFPQAITEAEADVETFAISPDEFSVAYTSGGQLWLRNFSNGSAAQPLVDLSGARVEHIHFSPDGTRIAYDTFIDDHTAYGGVWMIPTSGGEAQQILVNATGGDAPAGAEPGLPPYYVAPQFAPNLNAMLVIIGDTETSDYGIVDLSSGQVVNRVDLGDFDQPLWLPDGRVLSYTRDALHGSATIDPQKVVLFNPADNTQMELASLPYPALILSVSPLPDGRARLVIGSYAQGPQALRVVDMDTSSGGLAATGAGGGFMLNPVLSPDGTVLSGITHPNGSLTLRDVSTGRQVLLLDPPGVVGKFQWGTG
jgi:Tol biopolymer transport system component